MAESTEGWDGTVDEARIARILAAAVPGSVSSSGDFNASVVGGLRRVVLTPGESHHAFIRYEDTNPRTIDLDVPAVGRWDLIVQRRDWSTNSVSLVVLKGAETANTLPALPASPPSGFLDAPGVAADLPLWWAWVNAQNNSVVLRDVRRVNDRVSVSPRSGTTTERNARTPAYLEEWFDTTTGIVYIGSKTGKWRQKEGTIVAPLRAWDTTASSGAGRTDNLTLPTVLETNEDVLLWIRTGGSGFTFMSQVGVERNATNTGVTVRLMQMLSTTTQAFSIGWRVEPVAV